MMMVVTKIYRRYLFQVILTFFATCLFAAMFNLWIDPYGMFGSPRFVGINAIKPKAPAHIRYTKPYYADRVNMRTLIVGNSRPEMGIDPISSCWRANEQPVFNIGVPGLSFLEQVSFAEHAAAIADIKTVFLSLDLVDFFINPSVKQDSFVMQKDNNLNLRVKLDGSTNIQYSQRRLQDWIVALFSLETLLDSGATLIYQSVKDQPTRRADGFNPANDYLPIIRSEGQAVLFSQKNRETVHLFNINTLAIYQETTNWSWLFESLDHFLTRCGERGITVVLFINPYHADYLLTIALTGHWHLLDQWKRTLANIADRHHVVLWDFHAFDTRTEEIPLKNHDRTTTLKWFWEQGHYRREYGEHMIASMLGRDCVDQQVNAIRLTAANIEQHLTALHAQVTNYSLTHPEAVMRIKTGHQY